MMVCVQLRPLKCVLVRGSWFAIGYMKQQARKWIDGLRGWDIHLTCPTFDDPLEVPLGKVDHYSPLTSTTFPGLAPSHSLKLVTQIRQGREVGFGIHDTGLMLVYDRVQPNSFAQPTNVAHHPSLKCSISGHITVFDTDTSLSLLAKPDIIHHALDQLVGIGE